METIEFVVEKNSEGGYGARAIDFSIFTQGDSLTEIEENINDAMACHFDDSKFLTPKIIFI